MHINTIKKYRFALSSILILVISACNNGKDDKVTDDSSKNQVVTKMVPGTPIKYDSSKRYIYLTWDDSPQPPGTTICKRIFEEEGIKATFFAVGMHHDIEPRRKRTIDSIRNAYPQFLLANHSYTHAFRDNYNFFYTHIDSAVNDFIKAEKAMNIPVKIIRLPGRNTWASNGEIRGPKTSELVAKRLDSLGYNIIGWDIEWQFIKGTTPKQSPTELVNLINSKFESEYTQEANAIVILAHDRMFQKGAHIDSLKRFIQLLKEDKRNVFETIDHYPSVQRKK
jgi:peptidoglycan/xylan/chitin deacetylase (PgdA/CDA1 family)